MKSYYYANKVLNKLRGDDYTVGSFNIALFTVMPGRDGLGGTEVSSGGYLRRAAAFNAAANGQMANSADVLFPKATAPWGDIVGWGAYDAATGGNLLQYDTFPDGPIPIQANGTYGDEFMIPTGTLILGEE